MACLAQEALPGTQPLTLEGDLSAQMVAGIDQFLTRETAESIAARQSYWQRDFSSAAAYETSVPPNRERLRRIIGAVDARLPVPALEFVSGTDSPAKVAETDAFHGGRGALAGVRRRLCRGPVAPSPKASPSPASWRFPMPIRRRRCSSGSRRDLAPERQFARRLAENGCEVLVPVLIDRQDTWSGSAQIHRFTNQPHREWIYRQAYQLGRHIIGYEVQKVLAAVDFFAGRRQKAEGRKPRIGVAGYAEGGLIAFYAAALDRRIEAALVSGYFDSRQRIWEEPIYRNVFGLLQEFGDAEIATLIAPRTLIVEHSPAPKVDGPPPPRAGRTGAAPGKLQRRITQRWRPSSNVRGRYSRPATERISTGSSSSPVPRG